MSLRDTGNEKLEIDSTSGRKQPMLTASILIFRPSFAFQWKESTLIPYAVLRLCPIKVPYFRSIIFKP